ncbi:MAG: hypothetical protein CVT73_18310 [Alphaproteobacteria bacterium HGW-Alphaproteobacteria-12]|nr:MAG: hypothetical protein CVT73_18310 [Alphaproteobacteria bacterium HGW-Alphaproteobacteria-12]
MARRALRANNPEVVVVFQSILRMTGPDSVPGYVLTEEGLPNSEGPLLHQRVTMYLSLTNAVAVARNLGNAAPAPARADEEVIREPVRTERKKGGNERFRQLGWYRLSPDALYPGKDQYLRLTGEACREAGVVCVYVHGPIYYRYCDGYEAYMEALNAKIAAAGFLILDPAPRCVSEVEIDDTQDHIHWDLQQDFTAWYAQRLRAALALLPERPVIGN